VWAPAYDGDGDGKVRDGAWVAETTGLLDLTSWPTEMRVIVRKERPHPGAQLRITDADGHRITAFATNSGRGQLADLELRHRRRARCEDRIRAAKDTGLRNLPLHDLAGNQLWCAIVALACELTTWMQTLALADHHARRWEPTRLRLRLLSTAGRLAVSGRRTVLHLPRHAPWPTWPPRRSPPCDCYPALADARPLVPATPPQHPDRKPAPPGTTPGDSSHPHTTITRITRRAPPGDPQQQTHERSGLGGNRARGVVAMRQ
jgi:hypothetical protein